MDAISVAYLSIKRNFLDLSLRIMKEKSGVALDLGYAACPYTDYL